jgi:hypothetical protein
LENKVHHTHTHTEREREREREKETLQGAGQRWSQRAFLVCVLNFGCEKREKRETGWEEEGGRKKGGRRKEGGGESLCDGPRKLSGSKTSASVKPCRACSGGTIVRSPM